MKKELGYKKEIDLSLKIKMYTIITIVLILIKCFINERLKIFFQLSPIKIEFLTIFIIALIIYIFSLIRQNKSNQIYKEYYNDIKKVGIKVIGHIDDYSFDYYKNKIRYKLTISYINPNTNKNCIYITPILNFNPIKDLGNKICSVYIYEDQVYVTEFMKREKNQENIWDIVEESIYTQMPRKIIILILKIIPILFLIFIMLV